MPDVTYVCNGATDSVMHFILKAEEYVAAHQKGEESDCAEWGKSRCRDAVRAGLTFMWVIVVFHVWFNETNAFSETRDFQF